MKLNGGDFTINFKIENNQLILNDIVTLELGEAQEICEVLLEQIKLAYESKGRLKKKIQDTYNEIVKLKNEAKSIMYIESIENKNDHPLVNFKVGIIKNVEPDGVKLNSDEEILHRYIRYYWNKDNERISYPLYNEELVVEELLETTNKKTN